MTKRISAVMLALIMSITCLFALPFTSEAASVPKVTGMKLLSAECTKHSSTFSWNKVKGASGYQVAYTQGPKYIIEKTIKSGNTTKYTAKDMHVGEIVKFCVRAYKVVNGKRVYGSYNAGLWCATRPETVKLKSLSTKSKTITVKWQEIVSSNGYQIKYATNKDFKKAVYVDVNGNWIESKVLKKLTKGKTYYVKVRAVKTTDDKNATYGSWSNMKSIKCK